MVSGWPSAHEIDPDLLRQQVSGHFWDVLAEHKLTLVVTREYEHLVLALSIVDQRPLVTYLPLPHPSGLAVDRTQDVLYVASTRNPNQIVELAPLVGLETRDDVRVPKLHARPLLPVASRFVPGYMYLHDLAIIDGVLYGNSVGQNAIVRFNDGGVERVWWPRCIETADGPAFGRNYIQLNSIAAGSDIAHSYFTASSDHISSRRPGHRNFPVDRQGVVFSGATREPMARGLTRPHSARLYDEQVWIDNSGYGEMGMAVDGGFEPAVRLPGWTRGLAFHQGVAFAGTSRVIPRFSQYAPGLNVRASMCGVHAIDVSSGKILGSITWPSGNQIFAIEAVDQTFATGLPFTRGRRTGERERLVFYTFRPSTRRHDP